MFPSHILYPALLFAAMSESKAPESVMGLYGLGVMGQNLALNVASKGFRISVFNRTVSRVGAPLRARVPPCALLITGRERRWGSACVERRRRAWPTP